MNFKNNDIKINENIMQFYNKYKLANQWRNTNPTNWISNKKITDTDDDKIYSQYTSLLNKISESNFNDLLKDITAIKTNKKEHIDKLSELVFNKAITEKKFSTIYAKLAKQLNELFVQDDNKEKNNNNNNNHTFRKSLIGKCQSIFNMLVSGESNLSKDNANGCMRFIGELYCWDVLSNKVIESCLTMLLQKIQSNNKHKSDLISYTCTLIKNIGSVYFKKNNDIKNMFFEKVELLLLTPLENKDKFALMDIQDLEKNENW